MSGSRAGLLVENIGLMMNDSIFELNPPNATLCCARYRNSPKKARVGTSAWFGGSFFVCLFSADGAVLRRFKSVGPDRVFIENCTAELGLTYSAE